MKPTYSQDEMAECLHFIRLDIEEHGQVDECGEERSSEDMNSKEQDSTARGTTSWWPCLRCDGNPQKILDICAQVGYLQDGSFESDLSDSFFAYFLNVDYGTTTENLSLAVLLGGRTLPLPTNASRFIVSMKGDLPSRHYKESFNLLCDLGIRCRTDLALYEAFRDMKFFAPESVSPKHPNKRTAVTSQDGDDSVKKRAKSSNDETQKSAPTSVSAPLTECGPILSTANNAKAADTAMAMVDESSIPVNAAINETTTTKPAVAATAVATLDKMNVAPAENVSLTPSNITDIPSSASAAYSAENSAAVDVEVEKVAAAASNASTVQSNVGTSSSAPVSLTTGTAPVDADKASTVQKIPTNSPSSNGTGVAMDTEATVDENSSGEKQLPAKATGVIANEVTNKRSAPKSSSANSSSETKSSTGATESDQSGADKTSDDACEIHTPLTRAAKQRHSHTGSAKNSSSTKVIKSRPSTAKAKSKRAKSAGPTPKAASRKSRTQSTESSEELTELEEPAFKTIIPLLEKVGYTIQLTKNQFIRPGRDGEQVFRSEETLRRDMCAYGVTCMCGKADIDNGCKCWTDTEVFEVHKWIRYAILGGTCKSTSVPLIQPNDAKLLLIKLGFSEYFYESRGGHSPGFAFPGFSQENGVEGETFFHVKRDLWNHLARFGLPGSCKFDEISPMDRLTLEFHLSASYRDTFKPLARNSSGRRYKNRHAGTTTHFLHSDSTVVSEPSPPASAKPATKRRSIVKGSTKRAAPARIAALEAETPPLDSKSNNGNSVSPRVSVDVDTELAVEAPLLPVFDGTAMEKLEACLDALHPSYQLHQPTFTNDKNSKFVINMGKVKDFVGATLLAECRHSGDESKPAAMYCCGPPGVGKTSGISWCCKQAVESWDEDEGPTPILCEMNASEKSWDATLKELGSVLGMKTKITESRVYGKLRSGKQPLLFVVDEIDSFLSGKGSNSKTEGLSKMLEWANDTEIHFALIGISNSMNDEKAFEIQDAGEFTEIVMFSAYSEAEIVGILEARIGHSVVDPRMLSLCAKKVAASSGDVREALEMTSIAVRKSMQAIGEMDPTTVDELTSAERHLVGMKHLSQACKRATANYQKRIEDLPLCGKMIICVTAILSQENVCETTIRELKTYVTDCLSMGGHEDDILKLEDFIPLLSTLVDQGLLRASTTSSLDDIFASSRSIGDIGAEPIVIGTQPEDILKALERELKQPFFQQIRQTAQENKKKWRKN